jgi:signal transduction histidine kinase
VVNATVAEMRSLAEAKNLSVLIQNNLQNFVVFNDPIRVRHIITNLLSNAIKFTESGNIRVEMRELPGERVAIAVSDTGIGIAPFHVKQIFEAFRQIDQSTTRKYPGIGLGLPIINALLQMMGGTITVESKVDEGSIFGIDLPRQISSSIHQKTDEESNATHSSKKYSWRQHETPNFVQERVQREIRDK